MMRSEILIVAGNDSSGLSGIQRDCATSNALGVHARTCITATTSQNEIGLQALGPVNSECVLQQLRASSSSNIRAIKIGLLANSEQIKTVCTFIKNNNDSTPVICDPVFASSINGNFQGDDPSFLETFKTHLLPLCDVLTPNIHEAEAISGVLIHSQHDVEKAANRILELGANSVVIKGGHADFYPSNLVVDFFKDTATQFWLSNAKQAAENTRGTGCTFATAIAAGICLEYSLWDAIVIAKMTINQSLRSAYSLEFQQGPVNTQTFPNRQIDLPYLYKEAKLFANPITPFPPANLPDGKPSDLGIYPVVDSAEWIARLASTGITTIQLRNKTLNNEALRNEISKAISIAEKHNLRLFINDHWELAIELGAYGVHLGQEDLDQANIAALQSSGLRLGVSSHCHYEVARAVTFQPSYIACGPVYPTTSKDMPWRPHQLLGLQYWQNVLDYPVVAIGGISLERIPHVAKTGVSGIAMISAIVDTPSPERITKKMIRYLKNDSFSVSTEEAF